MVPWIILTASSAETPAARLITLDQCIELALRQNRELQIERLNPAIARASLSGAFGYYDPSFIADVRHENASDSGGFDPADFSRDAIYTAESDTARIGLTGFLPGGLSYTLNSSYANSFGERNALNFDSYSTVVGLTIRQPLLKNFWIDPGRFMIRIHRRTLEINEHAVVHLASDVVNRLQQSYYELIFAQESQRVRFDLLDARKRTLAGLERQVEQGLLTPTDTLVARAQLAALETILLTATNAVLLTQNALRTLLGEDWRNQPDSLFEPVERLWIHVEEFDLHASWNRGLALRPDLAQLRAELARANISLRFSKNQSLPSLDLVAGYGRRGASTDQLPPPLAARASASQAFDQLASGSAPSDMIGLVFSIPLGRITERANYRASRLAKEQAQLRLQQMEELVLREIADAVHTARLKLQGTRAAESASSLAAQALAAEERKLAGGTSSLFFVLQLQNDALALRDAELRAPRIISKLFLNCISWKAVC